MWYKWLTTMCVLPAAVKDGRRGAHVPTLRRYVAPPSDSEVNNVAAYREQQWVESGIGVRPDVYRMWWIRERMWEFAFQWMADNVTESDRESRSRREGVDK